jgi:AraC-like DNA-binding protein
MSAKLDKSELEIFAQYLTAIKSATVTLDNKTVTDIRKRYAMKQYNRATGKTERLYTLERISKDTGISITQVRRIITGENWSIVK